MVTFGLLCGATAEAQQSQADKVQALVAQAAASPSNGQNEPQVSATDQVTVTAQGETRDVQSVDSKALLEEAPGSSPILVLNRLPSVSVNSADPYGAYEWALRISVRGFNQNQLGFTLDDVPLGDMSYGNLNGLHISRAIIDENMGEAKLSQGTGSLDIASTSNLGGAIQFYSTHPLDKLGFQASQSFGSFNGHRSFARFDSGLLPTHTKFFFDGVFQLSDKWKGAGQRDQKYYQFNTKVEQFIGSRGLLTFYADYSDRTEVDYQDLNKVWASKLGYNWDNFGNWGMAIQTANAYNYQGQTGNTVFAGIPTTFPNPVSTLQSGPGDLSNDPEDAAYYGGGGIRKDFLSYLNYKMAITSHLNWKTTVYGHNNKGVGLWFTPYNPSYDNTGVQNSPVSLRTSEYGIQRGGVLSSLSYETDRNTLEGGVWFEKESFELARRFYATSLASPMHSLYDFPTNPFNTQWAYSFPSTVYQIHVQDQYKIKPNVTLSAGFKTSETNMNGILTAYNTGLNLKPTDTAANYAQGSLQSGKPFMPQVGVNWKLNKVDEFFADVAENVRAFQAGGKGFATTPWGTTQAGFNALTNNLKPESSWSEEVGYRHTDDKVVAQVNYFHVNFSNRLLAISQGPGIAGAASLLSNVGGVTTNGVDGAIQVRTQSGWSLYNALTLSKSAYDSNYNDGSVTYQTAGKVVVDSPEFLYKNELKYTLKGFDAHIGSDYMGKRYFTYINDNSVGGRFVADFGTSYHIDEVGIFNELKLQFNVANLASTKYWSSIGTNNFAGSDPTSVNNNTLQVGAPRSISGAFSMRF
ncbi:MAG TPA: TonB-dependent receptor [Granulicella sp.]|jgi:iron complex outermembrane receptor protein|nr:TonB-dependent receptor [Granulicella sp.]